MNCISCNNDDLRLIIKKDGMRVDICDCGLGKLRQGKNEAYYLSQYREEVPRTEEAVVFARERDELVVSAILAIAKHKSARHIDLCSEDNSVKNWAIFGEDCSYQTYGIIGRNDYKSLEEIPEGYFDSCSMFLSLEHVDDPVGFIMGAKGVLRDGGIFVCSVPEENHRSLKIKPNHTWYYGRSSLQELVGGCGFTPLAEIRHEPYLYVGARII